MVGYVWGCYMETLKQVLKTMPYGYIVKPFTDKDLRSNKEIVLFKFEAENNENRIPSLEAINTKITTPLRDRKYDVYV